MIRIARASVRKHCHARVIHEPAFGEVISDRALVMDIRPGSTDGLANASAPAGLGRTPGAFTLPGRMRMAVEAVGASLPGEGSMSSWPVRATPKRLHSSTFRRFAGGDIVPAHGGARDRAGSATTDVGAGVVRLVGAVGFVVGEVRGR